MSINGSKYPEVCPRCYIQICIWFPPGTLREKL
jgi:hypothetical protein